jgi:hypothetical protein
MADIRVKDSDWNSLSSEMQSQIQDIIAQQLPGATIVSDSGGISLTENISPEGATQALALSAGGDSDCVANCNSVRDVALAACASLGDPKAIVACTVATQIAAAICRASC